MKRLDSSDPQRLFQKEKRDSGIFSLRFSISLWSAFILGVLLCGLVFYAIKTTGKMDVALPAFFGFLPMTFFFVGVGMSKLLRALRKIHKRLESLEKGVTH